MFSDMEETWNKVLMTSQCNQEMIPELFYLPKMYSNNNLGYFGIKDNGELINHVKVQGRYSENYLYCMELRKNLRDYKYCKGLNTWIDLIFGSKQQSKTNKNIYFEFATPKYYQNLENKGIDIDRESLQSAYNFYQLPTKVFTNNHPRPVEET